MKPKKILIFNIFAIILIVFIFEIILIIADYKRISKDNFNDNKYLLSYHLKSYFKQYVNMIYIRENEFREPSGLNYKNKPSIILLGCSYSYGFKLKNEDAFHSLLSKELKRPVFNLSIVAGSERDALYLLRNKNLLNKILKDNNNDNVEYVIYTYMHGHKSRLLADIYRRSPKFKIINKGQNLESADENPIYNTYLFRKIETYSAEKNYQSEKTFDLLCLYLKEIKKESEKIFSNKGRPVKFLLLVYEDFDNNWDILEEDGIKVIKTKDITNADLQNTEYKLSKEDCHPNEKAWKVIVPALSQRL